VTEGLAPEGAEEAPMSRRSKLVLVALIVLVLGACVTINVYFPEAEIENLSERIEEEVAKQAAEQQGGDTPDEGADEAAEGDGSQTSSRAPRPGLLDALIGVRPAYAAEVEDPGISNPAIEKIIDSRAKRVGEIKRFKDMGVIGEANDGTLALRDLSGLEDLRQRARVQKLVREENEDRKALYREIAKAKDLEPSQIPRVASTYAETLRERAAKGHWIQLENGEWTRR
jgi:uncharacterized protein YdbL (DUF1318 family)